MLRIQNKNRDFSEMDRSKCITTNMDAMSVENDHFVKKMPLGKSMRRIPEKGHKWDKLLTAVMMRPMFA
ncbi:MAG: hypothetical protein RI957_1958 [Verrucomicrobiota bacterium]|jgi:hypothetical protein